MRRRTKAAVALSVIMLVTVPLAFLVFNMLNPPRAQAFDLSNAPPEIRTLQSTLKAKIQNGTFTWDDVPDYVSLCQYVAENSPEILDLIKGWNMLVVFHIEDSGYLVYTALGGSLSVATSSTAPLVYDVFITTDFETFVKILKLEETGSSAYQGGRLTFTGSLNDISRLNRINGIFNATLNGASTEYVQTALTFELEMDEPLLTDYGLTLLPCLEIILSNVSQTFGIGHLVVVDHNGRTIARLDNTMHTVHKFINSTTVLMGGTAATLELWNYRTGATHTLPVPSGHHEIDYNPITNTYMVLEYVLSNETWDGKYVLYDMLSEYAPDGNLVWQWDGREEYPFNSTIHTSLGINETYRGAADWMHCNSFAWDKTNSIIYLNVRNEDTILKIDYASKHTLWAAGRCGNLTVLDKEGNEVDTLFHHGHGLEELGNGTFIIFDNDLYNPTHPSTMVLENSTGYSRFVEFRIDEDNHTMRETWSWTPSNTSYYFPESGGDADRLPNGNTIGLFADGAYILGKRDPVIITEVTKCGQIAWELRLPGVNDTYYWAHRLERFYERPLVRIHNSFIDTSQQKLLLNLTTWDCIKRDTPTSGVLRILVDGAEFYEQSLEFLPLWLPKNIEVNLTDVPTNPASIELVIENADGIAASMLLFGTTESGSLLSVLFPVAFIIAAAIVVPALYYTRVRRTTEVSGSSS